MTGSKLICSTLCVWRGWNCREMAEWIKFQKGACHKLDLNIAASPFKKSGIPQISQPSRCVQGNKRCTKPKGDKNSNLGCLEKKIWLYSPPSYTHTDTHFNELFSSSPFSSISFWSNSFPQKLLTWKGIQNCHVRWICKRGRFCTSHVGLDVHCWSVWQAFPAQVGSC